MSSEIKNVLTTENFYVKYPKLLPSDVEKLIQWLQMQSHLPALTELEVGIFLAASGYSIESAKIRIDNFYTIRTMLPGCFSSRNILGEDIRAMKDVAAHLILPKRTPEGYKIILHKFLDADPAKLDFQKFTKMTSFVGELELFQHGPEAGIMIVVDLQGAKLAHIGRLNLGLIKKLVFYLTEAFPGQFVQFHYINSVSFMDKVMLLTKQIFKSELMEKVYWHKDLKKLSDFFPLSLLPSDYDGGEQESVKVLWEKYYGNLCEHQSYFLNEEKTRRVNENLRAAPSKNVSEVFGLEGNFKKLDID